MSNQGFVGSPSVAITSDVMVLSDIQGPKVSLINDGSSSVFLARKGDANRAQADFTGVASDFQAMSSVIELQPGEAAAMVVDQHLWASCATTLSSTLRVTNGDLDTGTADILGTSSKTLTDLETTADAILVEAIVLANAVKQDINIPAISTVVAAAATDSSTPSDWLATLSAASDAQFTIPANDNGVVVYSTGTSFGLYVAQYDVDTWRHLLNTTVTAYTSIQFKAQHKGLAFGVDGGQNVNVASVRIQ